MSLPHRIISQHALALTSFARRPSNTLNNTRLSLIQTRTKRSAATNNNKKSAISRAMAANQASNSSSSSSSSGAAAPAVEELVFGMRPVDYSILPPISYSPPAPPSKPGLQKYLWYVTLLFGGATVGYFYLNNQNDNFEYWEAMQSGEAIAFGNDDDDDEEWEDEEEEEGEEEEMANVNQLQQLNVDHSGGGGAGNVDNTVSNQKRGWFGWLRGKRGDSGAEKDPSVR